MKRKFLYVYENIVSKKNIFPRHMVIAASSWGAKIVIALSQVVSIRYLLDMLGEDGYAIFVLLSGLFVWGGIADFGIGNSLQNYISESRAKSENYNKYIKSSCHILFFAMVFLILILYLSSGYLSDLYLSAFTKVDAYNKENLFFISSVLFCCVGIGSVICKIWFAEQVGWKANLINAIAYFIGFIGVWLSYKLNINLNVKLSLAAMFLPLSLFTVFFLVKRYFKSIKDNIEIKDYVAVLRRGKGFFFFALFSVLVLQADYIVMSQKLSASDIVTYSILMKIFLLIFFIYSAVLQALWPVCSELCVRKLWGRLNKIIMLNIILGLVFILVFTFIMFLFKSEIIPLISNKIDVNINYSVFLMFGGYFCIRVWCDSFAMLLQSMNYFKPLLYLVPIQAVVGFSAQWVLAEKYGIIGILLGLSLSFIVTVVWGLPYFYYKRIKDI